MTVCTDVYVRPQSCDVISIYPSQVHPFVPPPVISGLKGGRYHYRDFPEDVLEDDEALALLLIEWSLGR